MAGRGESQRAETGQEDDDGNDGEDNDDVGADDDDDDDDDDRLNQVGRAGGATVNACR